MQHKVCNYCKIELPSESFSKTSKGGLRSLCKKCNVIKAKEYYYKNIEKVREKARTHAREVFVQRKEYMETYRADKRDELLSYAKEYYETHREHYLEVMAKYRDENKDAMNEYKRKFYELNKESIREQRRLEYAAMSPEKKDGYLQAQREFYRSHQEHMKSYHRDWSHQNRDRVVIHQNNRRNKKLELNEIFTYEDYQYVMDLFEGKCANCGAEDKLHIDHHLPLSKGFPLSRENAVILCATCNMEKHARLPNQYYSQEKLIEIEGKLQGRRVAA